jgi:diguanylate cyclase (GGDEF)-like protein/PAS domain S-box-containing protein
MPIDSLTIFWAFMLLQPVGIIVYWLTARRHPSLGGPVWWGAGCFSGMIGFGGILLQDVLPTILSVNLSNALLVVGTLCLWAGLRSFFGRHVPLGFLILVAFAAASLHTLFTFVWPSVSARAVIVSTFNGGGTLLALREVMQQRKASLPIETHMLGGLLAIDALLHLARIVGTLALPTPTGYNASNPLEGIFMLTFLVTAIGRLVLFIALISGRLQDEREEADAHLRASEMRFRKLLEAVPVSVQGYAADGTAHFWNRASEKIYGYSAQEALGRKYVDLIVPLDKCKELSADFDHMFASGQVGASAEREFKHKDGSRVAVISNHAYVNVPGKAPELFCVDTDISERKIAEEEINNLAFYDPLTGLPNRRLLNERLEQVVAASTHDGRHGALFCIDLDNFKNLNDNLGHHIGDLLLQQVAQRLSACVRNGDTVARLGGDEFLVILKELSVDTANAMREAEDIGKIMLDALNQTYELSGYEYHSTPSLGVTLFANHRGAIDDLLKRADLAMYQAKAAGRNTLRFFDPQMEAVVLARAAMELGLREAVQKQQFQLFYQPQVDRDGRMTGVEALLRWQHPERGVVEPLNFISLAEDTGLILPLGRWVLHTACEQLALWAHSPDMAHLTIAVNVSATQFHHRDFVEQVLEVIQQTGANPHRLKLELTESLLLDDVNDVVAKMMALKARGVTFALDDFGTGYSSLSYLKQLPLDQIKIDQSFVRDVLIDPNDASIARTIVALAQNLGLTVIAEGVETQAQRDFLASSGCHAYQGYFFGRPVPIEGFKDVTPRDLTQPFS